MVLHVLPLAPAWRPVPALRCRRATRASASSRDPASRDNEALARIQRARRQSAQTPEDGPADAPLASALPPPGPSPVERMVKLAQAAAAEEERAFVAAMRESSSKAQAPAASPPPILGSSPAAMRARLAKAREYKASKAAGRAAAPLAASALPAPAAPAAQGSSVAQATGFTAPSPMSAGLDADGSAAQAAGFLRDVLASSGSSADAALSPEQFTLKREAEMRSRGADLITIDAPAAGAAVALEGVEGYRPKVATWGVVPRPANISREFGGGRTIWPGEALEPEEVREARRARVAAAMANYRKEQGLTMDADAAAAAEAALAVGAEHLAAGRLAEALQVYCEAAAGVPLRSRQGGEATLQRAICLDSMGRSAEAKTLYQTVERHPAPGVAKKARQMLFGFQAMEDLKTHTISYSVGSAYERYFAQMTGQWASYVAPKGSESRGGVDALVATAIMLAPLVVVGVKVGGRLLAK